MSTFNFSDDFTYDDETKTLEVDSIDGVMKRLSSKTINLQTLTGQSLYTVPASKVMIPTGVIVRRFSTTINKGFSLGFNSGTFNDVFDSNFFGSFPLNFGVGSCFSLSLSPSISGSQGQIGHLKFSPHSEGMGGEVLNFLMREENTTPGTAIVDVFGYLVSE